MILNITFREEIRDLESKARVSDSSIHALKEQISYLKTKSKDNDRLHDEIDRLKNKLKHMENVELVVSGSVDEVEDMLRVNHSREQLCMLVSTLKRYVFINKNKVIFLALSCHWHLVVSVYRHLFMK